MKLDDHGQPVARSISAKRLCDREIDELLGLCRGILADGMVNQSEAEFLLTWLQRNRHCAGVWPANVLYPRVQRAVSGGFAPEAERELLETLINAVGGEPADSLAVSASAKLPLCDPAPAVVIEGREFCFTGRFLSGTRQEVESMVLNGGGITKKAPTRKTDYLVIGDIGSTDWIHSSYGRKIEKAVQLRDEDGLGISIIDEQHWAQFCL